MTEATQLRAARIAAGVPQPRLAEIAGVCTDTVWRAERRRVGARSRRAIADALLIPESRLFDADGNPLPAHARPQTHED